MKPYLGIGICLVVINMFMLGLIYGIGAIAGALAVMCGGVLIGGNLKKA